MEYEFIALDIYGEEAKWLCQFVEEILGWPKAVSTICMHYDNRSTIRRAQSTMYNRKSRHIRRRHKMIRQLISTRFISINYVKSKDNIACLLTISLITDNGDSSIFCWGTF